MAGTRCRVTLLVTLVAFALGCGARSLSDVRPRYQVYGFLREDPRLYEHLYASLGKDERRALLAAFIGEPRGYKLCCDGQRTPFPVDHPSGEPLWLETGLYPFVLSKGASATCREFQGETFSGALAVYNVDPTLNDFVFGRSRATKLFNPELLDKVRRGLLSSYTIKLNDEPRITYWIGNRTLPFRDGAPTVELDFSRTELAELRIDGLPVDDLRVEVAIYEPGLEGQRKQQHELWIRLKDGRVFEGQVGELGDNLFTAFMRIPCKLPRGIFDAAADGPTIKLSIMSEGGDRQRIAQIILRRS